MRVGQLERHLLFAVHGERKMKIVSDLAKMTVRLGVNKICVYAFPRRENTKLRRHVKATANSSIYLFN